MNYSTVFHLISDVTKREGVPCVLIGGFAINYHRVTRLTRDVDFLITEEDYNKIANFFEKLGYKRNLEHQNFAQLKSNQVSLMDVDFVFVEQETLNKIMDEGEKFKIVGQTFIVPSLNHLIALKLHSYKSNPKLRLAKDFPDIISLIRNNNVNIKDEEFKKMCLKYGTEEIYQRMSEAF